METLRELVVSYYDSKGLRTTRRVRQCFAHLVAFFGTELRLQELPGRVNDYVAHRLKQGAARSTIHMELTMLNQGLGQAVIARKIAAKPLIQNIGGFENIRDGFLSPKEVDSVVAYLPQPEREIVQFAFHTGWRKREILGLLWRNVDLDAGVIRLEGRATKNKRARTLPYYLFPEMVRLMQRLHMKTVDVEKRLGVGVEYVFHRDGEPVKSMDRSWATACKRAKVGDRLFHDLRRSAVRNMILRGMDRHRAMEVSGHRTASVFDRYDIIDENDLALAMSKLSVLREPQVSPPNGNGVRMVGPEIRSAAPRIFSDTDRTDF